MEEKIKIVLEIMETRAEGAAKMASEDYSFRVGDRGRCDRTRASVWAEAAKLLRDVLEEE